MNLRTFATVKKRGFVKKRGSEKTWQLWKNVAFAAYFSWTYGRKYV